MVLFFITLKFFTLRYKSELKIGGTNYEDYFREITI